MRQSLLTLLLVFVLGASAQDTYTNPVLGGDFPDPTILRDGQDYYLTNSAFDYVPGLVVYHSRDLVNWRPVSYALREYLGSIWAPDIKKYKGRYYIYFTVHGDRRTNCVVWADSPYGPWSDPVDLNIGDIDPCFVEGDDGKCYLVMSGGNRWTLTDNLLAVVPGSKVHFYDGWQYPKEWITEGFCLEGPKVYRIGRYFYYISAEGGTAGPPTSHMVVVARSESIDGPWENMPTNPLIRTWTGDERWWSKGHGSLIDTPDGQWYCVYHAYENGFYNLGRQTLMQPVRFTPDGWIVADGGDAARPMAAPPRQMQEGRLDHVNEFRLGLEWRFYKDFDPARVRVEPGQLTLKGQGHSLGTSAPMMFIAGEHRYEIEAEVEVTGDARAGLCMYYNAQYNVGTAYDGHRRFRYRRDHANVVGDTEANRLWLRLRNDNHVITAYWSTDGIQWNRETWGQEISGFNHNTLYDFQSVLPGLFCEGKGQATFRHFAYRTIGGKARETMRRATQYMMDSVAFHDGFVWSYLPDFSRQWGELEARRTMVWLQTPSTPDVGQVLLDAYHATGEEYYYDCALRVARCIAAGQLPCGGWNYMFDLEPIDSLKTWYNTIGRQAWRLEEFQHYYGNATFDDEATKHSAEFLLRTYLEKKDPSLRQPLEKAIQFVLESQYDNGGWPQRYPLMYDHPFRGKADYSSFITLNDNVMVENIDFLMQCYQSLGRCELKQSVMRAMYLLRDLQQPLPLAGWADQYTPHDLKPAHARSYEPRAVNTGTTVGMICRMMEFYRLTADESFLQGIPDAIRFLESLRLPDELAPKVRRTPLQGDEILVPRFIHPDTGKPMYVHRKGGNVVNGEYYTDSVTDGTIAHYSSFMVFSPQRLRDELRQVRSLDSKALLDASPLGDCGGVSAPKQYYYQRNARQRRGGYEPDADQVVEALDSLGRWLSPLRQVSNPYKPIPGNMPTQSGDRAYAQTMVGDEYDTSPYENRDVVGISTKTYIRNMTILIRSIRDDARRSVTK